MRGASGRGHAIEKRIERESKRGQEQGRRIKIVAQTIGKTAIYAISEQATQIDPVPATHRRLIEFQEMPENRGNPPEFGAPALGSGMMSPIRDAAMTPHG